MATVMYVVQRRTDTAWAVLGQGPRGGTRWIATYGDEDSARRVASELNSRRPKEVS